MPLRGLFATCALIAAVLAVVPATASAARKRAPRLVVTSITVPSGTLDPTATFTVTGRVANRGRRASRALLSASLRTERTSSNAYAVGARNLARIAPRRARRFTIRARLPRTFPVSAGRQLHLTICVRTRRGGRPRCREARRRIVFSGATTPAPQPQPQPQQQQQQQTTPGPAGGNITPPGDDQSEPTETCPATATKPSGTEVEPAAPTGTYTAGGQTLNDRLFPDIGNTGYDAQHYDLAITYQPLTQMLNGVATLTAVATQDLSEFALDFTTLTASAVTVDGAAATFAKAGDKLVITPAAGLDSGSSFDVVVTYGGLVMPYTDPDGSNEGWVATGDGAFVVNEPVGAMSWFPNNNVPSDKATYDVTVTVPATSTVFGNGQLVENTTGVGTSTWHWREDSPMATYLVTATNGAFDRVSETHDGVVYEYGFQPSTTPAQRAVVQRSAEFSAFMASTFCVTYPFTASGGVVDTSSVGYALESQTRPMYATPPGVLTTVHEISHQWFGDSVTNRTWSDLWLNEGHAQFVEWLWNERANGSDTTTAEQFDALYDDSGFDWSIPPAEPPTAADLFSSPIYERGAMTLEATRQIIGEPAFFAATKAWLLEHAYSAATTADWIAIVKREAPADVDDARLDEFFQQWLYEPSKPTITPENF